MPAQEDAASQPHRLRQGFVGLVESLLRSVAEVFPECAATEEAVHLFGALVKGDEAREDAFIRQCGAALREHGDALQRRDDAGLFAVADSMSILKPLDLRKKWADPDFTQESKAHLWQYLASLKTYADLYCALPTSVMGKIERVADSIGERLRSGSLDLASMDIAGLGNELLGQLSPEELRNFEGSLPQIYDSVSQVAASVASQAGLAQLDVGALMKGLVEAQKPGEAPDVAAVMRAVGGILAPGGAAPPDLAQLLAAQAPPARQARQALKDGPPQGRRQRRRD